jgi:2'-5' RNA ligase
MAELEPEQYFYKPCEFHITVLTLIIAVEDFALDQVPTIDYNHILARICASFPPFRVRFQGVTASAGAVMAQGLVENDALNRLRDNLREALSAAGYGHWLDRRYRATTAHATLVRFRTPLRDSQRFIRFLLALREQDLGETIFSMAEFVFNDWYMAEDVVRTIQTYKLAGA